ncbi:cytochrome C oxidase subunit II [Rhizobium mesoamericanum]|uniref:cytochrome C oxidase subunit II n=1 Tax=Rhizobium mesoamericanum TaxID=1079800 RepID=UPI001F401BCC|nr:cytochrome C oxidase subunit II [Rhizobium mesoamericanum]
MANVEQGKASLLEGIVPESVIARTEKRWLIAMVAMLAFLMAIVVTSGITHAIRAPTNVETIDPTTLHISGEFIESNLGSALEPDGSITVRGIADQYAFVPECMRVPAGTPVKFRLTSVDVIHGFLLPFTNVNTMVVPGFVSELRTRFDRPGVYRMPCNEFCGPGHQGMWTRVVAVPREQFPSLTPTGRAICAQQ